MTTVKIDPSSYTYALKPLDAAKWLSRAPGFMSHPAESFASSVVDSLLRSSGSNSSVNAKATVQVLQAHMGVNLFRQQRDTSRLLAGLVYKLMIPDKKVPTGTRFCRRYVITDQREAQRGTYDTVGNGVQTRTFSQVFQHTSKVVTMRFGCLLGITVDSHATEIIRRELESVGTSWELTRTIEVLRYCQAQPTLVDRVMQRLNKCSRAERLDCVLTMAELTCGMVNVQPRAIVCILENARRALGCEGPEVVVMGDTMLRVVSQSASAGNSCIVSEVTTLTPEVTVYTASQEAGRGGGGDDGGKYDFTMEQVSRSALGDESLTFTSESSFRDGSIEMNVNYIHLGGGSGEKIPIAHVDAVQMERGREQETSAEHKAFCNTQGFKWEYFTVGCAAPALGQVLPSNVLACCDAEITYKQVAQRSPSVSYLHRYDGTVVGVTLRELHARGNPAELFGRERRNRLQDDLNVLLRNAPPTDITAEKMVALAYTDSWCHKIRNPASLLEFDTRNMVVPGNASPSAAAPGAPARWRVRPRVALFNSSSMNSVRNEITQIGSELLAYLGDSEQAKDVAQNLAFLDDALHCQNVASMLTLREHAFGESADELPQNLGTGQWSTSRLYWSWVADPICAVHLRKLLCGKEDRDRDFSSHERVVLVQLEKLINGTLGLFRRVVGDRRNSVIASMPACFDRDSSQYGYPEHFTLEEIDYCNLMYWIILPALGARVYRRERSVQQPASSHKELVYRQCERMLDQDLKTDDADRLCAGVLKGTCVFSKVKPQGFEADVSELFEPTACGKRAAGAAAAAAGFHPSSVVTYMWAARLDRISEINNHLAKALLGMHYSTLLTHEVIRDHYDTAYYSGMSYLLFRGVRFTGCGVALMRQKSALYTLGTQVTCSPTAHNTHQVQTVNQCCESVVIPESLESPGLYIPDLYMKDVRGGGVHVDGQGGPYEMVIADAFNGFCPESESSSGSRSPYLFMTGRSQQLQNLGGSVTRDPLMREDAYTCMPTLLRPFSSALRPGKRETRRDDKEDSNRSLFRDVLHVQEMERAVLNTVGDPFKDTVERATGNKRATEIMQPLLGVAFCGTYSVGLTSDKKLMAHSPHVGQEPLVDRLAPRISGTGVFSCNPVQATNRVIAPVFSRLFFAPKYNRVLML